MNRAAGRGTELAHPVLVRHGSHRLLALAGACACASAAVLPPHEPLRVVVVSDYVNPHGLPPADLVEPGDISAALLAAGNGLSIDPQAGSVVEIPTNGIEQATALLQIPASDPASYDVLIYFCHRIPNNGNDAQGRQDAFVAAVEAFLRRGGGVICFHHGAYSSAGKAGILDIIGATASGPVPWNTTEGQNVIGVAPGHFITSFNVAYTGTVSYGDAARGVPLGTYPFFNNTPDERYLTFNANASAGTFRTLFGSNYVQNGTTHLLGFTHHRPAWQNDVVGYQPGEYQPNALDVDGPNFQVLANAIVYLARPHLTAVPGPAPGGVALSWERSQPEFGVYRSTDPASVVGPANLLGSTSGRTWDDNPPPGGVFFYQVARL